MYTSRAILAVSVFLVVGDAFRKKSSKSDAELDEGSFVEAEANKKVAERAQTLKDVKALAHKVVAGEEKINNRTLKLLEELRVVINQAEVEVGDQRRDQQTELDVVKGRFDSCDKDYMTKTEEIDEREGKRTAEFGVLHNKNRYTEQVWLEKKAKDCGAFQEMNWRLRLPFDCVPFPEKCKFTRRKDCIDKIAAWSSKNKEIYEPMRVLCEKADFEHENARKIAEANQRKFEWEQCRWDTELNDACNYFTNVCWDEATRNREKVHSRISKISEPALKAECEAIKNIQCYLDVLKAKEEEMPAKLADCVRLENTTYNCTWKNEYHGIPNATVCKTVPSPCDEKWRKDKYGFEFKFKAAGEQFCDVFPDGAQKVKPIKCLEGCESEPVPTKCTAAVYQHKHFTGNVATFSVGEYKKDDFVNRGPLRDNNASSIKVQGPRTCKATLYEFDNFEGWNATFEVGEYDLEASKNEQASSIKVTLG